MRRFMVLPMAALLALAVAAPVAAGPNVHNTSGGAKVLVGDWYGDSTYGFASFAQENGYLGWGDIYEESGTYALCEGGIEWEGPYGFQGTRTWGYVYDVRITIDGRFANGAATGTAVLFTDTVDECAGEFSSSETTEQVSVNLTGTGSVASFRGHGSYQIPSEFNGHSNYKGKERQATGTIDLGSLGNRDFGWALMVQYSWLDHSNS